jgi:hypothetical protein
MLRISKSQKLTSPLLFHNTSLCSSDSLSPSSNRVALVERCTGSCEWEEAPEDLALSLSQLCVLWATVSPLGDRGARDTAAALTKIVAEKVNSNLASAAATAVKGGRTVDRMLSHHAEACALYLLKISSPIQAIKRSVSSSSAEQEPSFIAALLVCGLKQESHSRPGWGQKSTTMTIEDPTLDNCEARRLLWKILSTCCVALSDQHVRTALTRVCITDHFKNRSALLELLRGASESWHGGGESCDTTLLLLSWCISAASSSAASTAEDARSSVKRGDCLSGREIVLSALKSLSPHSRSSLELAAELLASRLSAAERTAVRHLFTIPP